MKKFLLLFICGLCMGMDTASLENLIPPFFQKLTHEAQTNVEIPLELQDDISLQKASSSDLIFYDSNSKLICLNTRGLITLKNIPKSVLWFLLHVASFHKLYDINHIPVSHLEKKRVAELETIATCNCFKCVEKFYLWLYKNYWLNYWKHNRKNPTLKERDDSLKEKGFLTYQEKNDYIKRLKIREKTCSYHQSFWGKSKKGCYKIIKMFLDPIRILCATPSEADKVLDQFYS